MTKEELAAVITQTYNSTGKEPMEERLALLYLDWLNDVPGLTNPRCIIFAGMWCSYSQLLVANFLTKAVSHGKNINSLQELYWLFHDNFATELFIDEKKDEFAMLAREYLGKVGDLDLTEYGVPEYDKAGEWL